LVKRAQQNLDLARTANEFAQANWQRVQNVTRQGAISETDRDLARREALMREREVYSAEFGIKVAEYELAQAKAALLQIDAPQGGAAVEVKPPVSGVILRVMQESSTIVTPGTPILEVGDTADIEIEAEILSRDAVAIVPGAHAEIEQWGGEKPLTARVRRVEPAAFTKVSALGVEEQRVYVLCDLVDPPESARALGDRFRVDVKVAVWHTDDTLLVPAGALFREGNSWKTFVYNQDRAHRTTVQAGRTDGRHTQVLGGLTEGTEVLLHPPDTVTDGTRVRKRVR
jgi:HlyD family secretion protein